MTTKAAAAFQRATAALPAIKLVENVTLREQVTVSVRNALMNGHFQPGQAVTVKAICTLVGASVMPAREAMHKLVAEGALELRANRTVIVPTLSQQEFDELTDLRCHMEGLAAARAVDRVTDEHISQLMSLDAAMRASVPTGNVDAYLDNNFKFHYLIYKLGASSFVLSLIERLWVRVGPLIRYSLNGVGLVDSGAMHANMIKGLQARDELAVQSAVHADIAGAAKLIRQAKAFALSPQNLT